MIKLQVTVSLLRDLTGILTAPKDLVFAGLQWFIFSLCGNNVTELKDSVTLVSTPISDPECGQR